MRNNFLHECTIVKLSKLLGHVDENGFCTRKLSIESLEFSDKNYAYCVALIKKGFDGIDGAEAFNDLTVTRHGNLAVIHLKSDGCKWLACLDTYQNNLKQNAEFNFPTHHSSTVCLPVKLLGYVFGISRKSLFLSERSLMFPALSDERS